MLIERPVENERNRRPGESLKWEKAGQNLCHPPFPAAWSIDNGCLVIKVSS